METSKLLTEVEHNSEGLIHGWDFIQTDRDNRLYYKARDKGNGFDAYAVKWVSCYGIEEPWDSTTLIHRVFESVAFWDGMRHMWFGEDDECSGYLYYQNLCSLELLLTELRKLEIKYCKEYDGPLDNPSSTQ